MEREFGASVKLIKGQNGVFEVVVDGELIFSKRTLGRFPDDDEIAKTLRGR